MTDKKQALEKIYHIIISRFDEYPDELKEDCREDAEKILAALDSLGLLKDVQPAQEKDWILTDEKICTEILKCSIYPCKLKLRNPCPNLEEVKETCQAQIDYLREKGLLKEPGDAQLKCGECGTEICGLCFDCQDKAISEAFADAAKRRSGRAVVRGTKIIEPAEWKDKPDISAKDWWFVGKLYDAKLGRKYWTAYPPNHPALIRDIGTMRAEFLERYEGKWSKAQVPEVKE